MALISYREAAALLGVPVGTLYAWVSRKQLPHVRLGQRLVRFSQEELETWVREHHVAIKPVANGESSTRHGAGPSPLKKARG